MKTQNILTAVISLFCICSTLWGLTEQEEVTGLFSKDSILPCPFPPGHDEVIHWKKGDKIVHVYYNQKDQLQRQDTDYRNRTHLFHENIPSGNASLKLSKLTLSDEGVYNCYVGTAQTATQLDVMLHVRVSSYYALEYQKTDTERILKCYAFLTYPVPRISWVQGNTSIQEIDREETRDGALYSLRSDQKITNTASPYHCHIHLPRERWSAEWMLQDQLSNKEGSSIQIPCENSNDTAYSEGFSVVWTRHRNAGTLVMASFNGTSHSYQPRVQIKQDDFSLMLHNLSADNSGDYVCNISTPHYTKLTVTALQVENAANTRTIVGRLFGALVSLVVTAVLF